LINPDNEKIAVVALNQGLALISLTLMSSELIQNDRKFIWHPYTQQLQSPDMVAIVEGQGAKITDENGNSYIDAISSWWVTLHGHAHPYIAEKLYRQALKLEQVIFAGFTHPPAVELAGKLVEILPGNMQKIFYSDNGSTAVEVALKMAVQFWKNQGDGNPGRHNIEIDGDNGLSLPAADTGRNKILALRNSYHGDTFGAMSVSERGVFTKAFDEMLFDVIFIDAPDEKNFPTTLEFLEETGEEIACFIYEPLVQGAGGMQMTEPHWLNQLLAEVKSKNIICIADEVMTGFGRTGKLFASSYMDETPDIICLSKGLTGGTMALSVTACTERIHTAFVSEDKLKTLFHGHSFTANPLACAAALASYDLLMKDECIGQIEKIIDRHAVFAGQLRQSTAYKNGWIANVRQCGTILAFEADEKNNDYLNPISRKIHKKALKHGVLLRPLGNTVYILPPYCITEDELQQVYDVILLIIKELNQH
jgi:adenosylmethionine-8-amino-7-oxononanoate aminotransferase